jgi:hypothetical protein
MRSLALLLLLPACTWVGQGDWDRANDRDGDGFLADINGGDDCDDGDAAIHPGADEQCNGRDDDCDGETDEDPVSAWYPDDDGDSFGDEDGAIHACDQPQGTVATSGDCDDGDAAVHPGADEQCNGTDDDCDDVVDEDAVDTVFWYLDGDGDGHGVPEKLLEACEQPSGYASTDDDCDDDDPGVYPGASELLDGQDQDCDDVVDNLDAAGAAAWSLRGTAGYARAGEGSQGRADYDGDGHADLLVGAPGASSGDRTGLLGLWWGGALALEGQATTDTWTPDLVIEGGQGAERSFAQRGTGRLDGETASLVVATQDEDATSCWVFFADDLGQATLTIDDASVELAGCGGEEPWQLIYGGDLDGDGLDDLPVLPDPFSELWVLAGRASTRWNSINGKPVVDHAELRLPSATGDHYITVSLEGDLDGDGCDELLIGDNFLDGAGDGSGALQLLYGDPSALDDGGVRTLPEGADAVLLGEGVDHYLGQVSTAADLDGDGHAELLVAATGPDARTVYLVPGGLDRLEGSQTIDAISSYRWTASESLGSPGWGLGAGEDIDGDAVPDVLVSSAAATPSQARAWLISGVDAFGGLDLDSDVTAITGLNEPMHASQASDLNGDGSGELLLADPMDEAAGVQSGVLHLLPGYR